MVRPHLLAMALNEIRDMEKIREDEIHAIAELRELMNRACLLFLPFYSDTGGPRHWTLLVLERFGEVKREGAKTAEGLEAAEGLEGKGAEEKNSGRGFRWLQLLQVHSLR